MQIKMTQRAAPSKVAIEAEAARVEKLLDAVNTKIESSQCDLRTFMHLQMCRAELQTYFSGLLYAMGYTGLLDTQHVEAHLTGSKTGTFAVLGESLLASDELPKLENHSRLVQCFEC